MLEFDPRKKLKDFLKVFGKYISFSRLRFFFDHKNLLWYEFGGLQ